MNDEPLQNPSTKEIFLAARAIPVGEQRDAYLREAVGDNESLRIRVEKMLLKIESDAPNRVDQALATVELRSGPTRTSSIDIKTRPVIGPYKLVHSLGDGGMGEVFIAEQREPIQRTVALKLIKRGMDSDEVLARFEAERQALAMMNHPNIAKVLDAGQTDDGRPYFVMDLVRGIPITEYCDQHKLDTRKRLELLVEVCQAVQHAHQKGIIHRDLKPSNILVELHDVRHVPKVIDFGVAKAINQRLTERTLITHFTQMVGTPLYMSPEQAELSGQDVDTRSDVYALGVLLYELLTGTTPFEKETLRSAGFDEMRRIIREDDPPRPSHRISTLNDAQLSTLSERQQVPIPELKRSVERELDWIVLKALEKDRDRRYESASALAADIRRYLVDEAVEACPPSIGYRAHKFSRRHRGLLWTSALVGGVAIVGLAVTGWQAIKIKQVGETAMNNAAVAAAVNEFLTEDLLGEADPHSEPDRNVRLRTVLDRAAKTVGPRFADRPLVEAAIRQTLGDAYVGIGQGDKAKKQFQRCVEIRSLQLGGEHTDTLKARRGVGLSLVRAGRIGEAEKELRDLVTIQKRVLGPEHADTLASEHVLAVSIARRSVGSRETSAAVERSQNLREAETILRNVVVRQTRLLGKRHSDTLNSMHSLATMLGSQGRHSEAEKLFRDLLATQRKVLHEDHPQIHSTMCSLAIALAAQSKGQSEEAKKILRDLLQRRRQLGALDDPSTANVMRMLARASYDTTEAGELFREVLAIRRRVLGDEDDATIFSMYELAEWLFRQGDLEACRKTYREALEISRRVTEGDASSLYDSPMRLGELFFKKELFQDAEELLRESLRQCVRQRGDHRYPISYARVLALAVVKQGRFVEAANISLEAVRANPKTVASKDVHVAEYIDDLTENMNYYAWKLSTSADPSKRNPKKALDLARVLVELRPERTFHWRNLGMALYQNGQWAEAVKCFEKAGEISKDEDLVPHMFLAMAHWQLGNNQRAKEIYAQAAAWIDVHNRDNEKQKRLRGEAEALMGLSEQDRKQLIANFYSNAEWQNAWFFYDGRGIWHQDRGEYQLALEDFRKAEQNSPSDYAQRRIIFVLLQLGDTLGAMEELPDIDELETTTEFIRKASLIAYADDKSQYRQLCQRMLEKFADGDAISDVERTCKVCSILPGVIEPSKLPLMALETGLEEEEVSSEHRHWFTLAQAMVRYRLGDSENALAAIRETQTHEQYSQTPAVQALALPLMAMCQYKLGLREEANQTLDKATSLIEGSWPKLLNDEFGNGWPDWLFAETLRREAAALLSNDGI